MLEIRNKKLIEYPYDCYHKQFGMKLKQITNPLELQQERTKGRAYLQKELRLEDIVIEIAELKKQIPTILMQENSSQYLWMLNSKYIDNTYETNYLDCISPIFEKSNKVTRKGVNTYKINGWMTHSLYVYQIVNDAIAKEKIPNNFPKTEYIEEWVKKSHQKYIQLSKTSQFILKILCLIHDIGVIESIKEHPICGIKYVEQAVKDLGIDTDFLTKYDIPIPLSVLIVILQVMIQKHCIYAILSGEASDRYVEEEYIQFLEQIPQNSVPLEELTTLLYLFTIADVIAVDESIFDETKYQRLEKAYVFFEEILQHQPHTRNKKQVAIERICDLVGDTNMDTLQDRAETSMKTWGIKPDLFWMKLFQIKHLLFLGPIMKEVNQLEEVVRILDRLFYFVEVRVGKQRLVDTTIIWIPNNKEKEFVRHIKNESFFNCIEQAIKAKNDTYEYMGNRISINQRQTEVFLEIETIE